MTKKEFSSSISPGLIVGGVVAGTLLGAATAFFLTTAKNRPLRKELSDIYHQFHEKLNDLAHSLSEKSEGLRQGFSGHYFTKSSSNHTRLNLLIGSLAGGVLGISAVLFLTTDSGKDIFEKAIEKVQCLAQKTHEISEDIQEKTSEVIETFEDRVNTWADAAQHFIGKLNGAAKNGRNGKSHSSGEKDIVDNVIDWAAFGLRLYQSLKK